MSFIYNRHVKTTSTRDQYLILPVSVCGTKTSISGTSENRLISLAPDVVGFQRFHRTTQYLMSFWPTDEFCLFDVWRRFSTIYRSGQL